MNRKKKILTKKWSGRKLQPMKILIMGKEFEKILKYNLLFRVRKMQVKKSDAFGIVQYLTAID